MSTCHSCPFVTTNEKTCVCPCVGASVLTRDYLVNHPQMKKDLRLTLSAPSVGPSPAIRGTSIVTLYLLVTPSTRFCPLLSAHPARSHAHTHTHPYTRIRQKCVSKYILKTPPTTHSEKDQWSSFIKWTTVLNSYFTKENICLTNKHAKSMFNMTNLQRHANINHEKPLPMSENVKNRQY